LNSTPAQQSATATFEQCDEREKEESKTFFARLLDLMAIIFFFSRGLPL